MQKEIDRKIILCFSSVSCTGKSKTTNLILEQFRGLYLVVFDKQKWLLSGYERTSDKSGTLMLSSYPPNAPEEVWTIEEYKQEFE